MHLLAPLIGGISGAEGGTALLYVRGSTTRATYYLDFAGNIRSGADVELDPYGSARVYVNSLVEVVVLDQAGAEVRRFVAGGSASATEQISGNSSFSGVNYETGAFQFNTANTLKRSLDRVADRFGAVDFGTLQTTFAPTHNLKKTVALLTQFKVATEATYDAAFGRAIAFVTKNGGGVVYLKAASYNISAPIVVPSGVTLMGEQGGAGTEVRLLRNGVSGLVIDATTAPANVIGIHFQWAEVFGIPQPEPMVRVLPGSKAYFERCDLGDWTFGVAYGIPLAIASDTSNQALDDATEVSLQDCRLRGLSYSVVDYRRTRPKTLPKFLRCSFQANKSALTGAYGVFERCYFEPSNGIRMYDADLATEVNASSPVNTALDARLVVAGSVFKGGSYAFSVEPLTLSPDGAIVEDRNQLAAGLFNNSNISDTGDRATLRPNGGFGSILPRVDRGASAFFFANDAGTKVFTASGTGTVKIVASNDGGIRRLFVHNNSGGVITQFVISEDNVTTGDFPLGAAGVSMGAGTWRLWEWVQWPDTAHNYDGTQTPKAHFAVICDGVAVGSPA